MKDDIQLDELRAAVHRALKSRRSRKAFDPGPLAELASVQNYLRDMGLAHDPPGVSQAVQAVVRQALERLADRQPEAAQLLERRFVWGETVVALAHEMNVAANTVYYRQSQAINSLAAQLLRLEQATDAQDGTPAPSPMTEIDLPWELPPPSYTCLFGVEEKRDRLVEALRAEDGPALVIIDGMGGVGKTSLAQSVAEQCEGHFDTLLWLTVRREAEYDTWRAKRPGLERPPMSAGMILDAIAVRLGLRGMAHESVEQKQAHLASHLDKIQALIVIDNLETAEDIELVVDVVRQLERPTRFLITSRYRLEAELIVHLGDLSLADSLALLRHEAGQRGLEEMKRAEDEALEAIYQVVGGNPLALKLVVGQATHLPLKRVLDALRQSPTSQGSVESEFYGYLYQQSWAMLSSVAQELLLTMPVLPITGGTWDDLQALSGLDPSTLNQAIAELVRLSLLNAAGWPEKVYSIHRLTHTFLMSEVMKWW